MRSTKKTTAIVLAGAVGLSSVAYGVGTQVDGGSSVAAAGNNAGVERGAIPPGFGNLAKELGVDADELRNALGDFHESEHADMRSAFAAALADALGKSTEDVQSALDSLQSERHERLAADLAQALGVEADAVSKALDELKDERPEPGQPGEPGGFAAALAEKLGLETDDVEASLMELHPDRRDGRHGPRHAMPLRQLAAELDVTRGELRKALREMRAGADFRPQDRRDELVEFLADRFELSEEKVDEALPEFAGRGPAGPGGHHGPGGPRGPGGPGGPDTFGPGGP